MAENVRGRRDALGTVLGLAVFLVGIGLLLLTFKLAYDMFAVPPSEALGLTANEELQLGPVGSTVTGLLIRVLLLIAMGVVGSLVANRGVHMYTESRGLHGPTVKETVTERTEKPGPSKEETPKEA